MVIRLIIIAIASYLIASINSSALISKYVFQREVNSALSYSKMRELYKTKGVIYLLILEFFKALVILLIGALLLRGKGFPSVGKLFALFFALFGQLMPIFNDFKAYKNMVWGALLLLLFDWRLCLVCVLVFVLIVVLTKYVSLGALAAAVVFPISMAVFGGWWLKILLSVLCSVIIILVYRSNLMRLSSAIKRSDTKTGTAQPPDTDG